MYNQTQDITSSVSRDRFSQSFVFRVIFCGSFFDFLYFVVWSLFFLLFFFYLRILFSLWYLQTWTTISVLTGDMHMHFKFASKEIGHWDYYGYSVYRWSWLNQIYVSVGVAVMVRLCYLYFGRCSCNGSTMLFMSR